MRKSSPTEAALDALSELRLQPGSPQRQEQLQSALAHRSNLVVAKAAKLIGELRLAELIPQLVTAFERFIGNPMKLDKGCAAMTQIVLALHAMESESAGVYLKGIRHVQLEPGFGGPVDTAVQLRGASAFGLVRTHYPDTLFEIANLLVDKEPRVRIDAARAIGTIPGDAGELLLRLKALTGDSEPEVLAECFSGILAADNARSLAFVGGFVDHADEAVAEAAVIALGLCRRPQALDLLRDKWERTALGPMRKALLLAFATARQEAAIEFLLSLLSGESAHVGVEVIGALRMYRDDERVRNAVETIVRRRDSQQLTQAFRSEF